MLRTMMKKETKETNATGEDAMGMMAEAKHAIRAAELSAEEALSLVSAAIFLDAPAAQAAACRHIAKRLERHESPLGVRREFGIVADLSRGEELEVLRESLLTAPTESQPTTEAVLWPSR